MSNSCNSTHLPRGVSRRDLIRLGLAGAGVAALGPIGKLVSSASAVPQVRKRLVVLNLFGGNDSLNMVVPRSLQAYYDRRTRKDEMGNVLGELFIPDGEGLAISGTTDYTLHPMLPRLQQLWNDGDAAAVTKVGYPRANLSHFSSQDIYSLGVRDGFAPGVSQSGWIARYADLHAPTPLGAVSVGVGRPLDFVGGSSKPLLVGRLSSFRISGSGTGGNPDPAVHAHRVDAVKSVLERHANATGNTFEAQAALSQAHDLASQVQDAVANYSNIVTYEDYRDPIYDGRRLSTRIGNQMKDIATLIEGGFETQVFFTGYGGFDTHGEQGQGNGSHADLMTQLDDAIGSFSEDMKRMNLWDDMVIVVMTEFGRRNFVNGSDGTDHGHGYTELVIGGAVNGGVYGPDYTDPDIADVSWLDYGVDFRSVYKEIVGNHLGGDPAAVFPEALEIENTFGII